MGPWGNKRRVNRPPKNFREPLCRRRRRCWLGVENSTSRGVKPRRSERSMITVMQNEPQVSTSMQQQQEEPALLRRTQSFPGVYDYRSRMTTSTAGMITHRAADGSASGMILSPDDDCTMPFPKLPRALPCRRVASAPNNNDDDDNPLFEPATTDQSPQGVQEQQARPPESLKRKVIRRSLFAVFVFFGQVFASVALKRYGIIERDLNEVMAERLIPVMPELQERLDFLELKMQETIDMARHMTPGFNETMYWLRLSNQMAELRQRVTPTPTVHHLRTGQKLAAKGAVGQYPVVMVPGFVTSGLEVWKGKDCMESGFFRQRVWGGFSSAQYWLRNSACVMRNLALDPVHGGDPDGIKLRSAEGFNAADFFVGNDWFANYWVWARIFENLADLGYDGSMMTMEAYDWRLGMKMLEERDGYLTHLKHRIEAYHKTTGKKCILISHSMGAIVIHYFFNWVTKKKHLGGGGGGAGWVDQHVHAFVNIAGAQLGVVKAASALMSGEMSDTVILGALGSVIEKFIPRRARRDLWGTWGSLWSMFPKGDDGLWATGADILPSVDSNSSQLDDPFREHLFVFSDYGIKEGSQSDESNSNEGFEITCNSEDLLDPSSEPLVNRALQEFASREGNTVQESIDLLLVYGGGKGPGTSASKHFAFSHQNEQPSFRTWHDVTQTPLPKAPKMRIYSLYGVGADTERGYYYKQNLNEGQFIIDNSSFNGGAPRFADPPFILDTSVEDPKNNVVHGIKFADGDGSVPLLSLGYMSAGPWRDRSSGLNPSGSKTVIREYVHRPSFDSDDPLRKGRFSAEHVDILGNEEMMEDLMRIVTDFEVDTLTDKIESDINGIVQRIKDHPTGGLTRPRKRRWAFPWIE